MAVVYGTLFLALWGVTLGESALPPISPVSLFRAVDTRAERLAVAFNGSLFMTTLLAPFILMWAMSDQAVNASGSDKRRLS